MTAPRERTYDRAELDLILRTAAESESVAEPSLPAELHDGLSLAQIRAIGAEVGIGGESIAAAALRLALTSAHANAPRWHYLHTVAGTIPRDQWARLADDLRSVVDSMDVRHTSDGVDAEIHKRDGELGQVRVSIRSENGATSIAVWSTAPHLGPVEIAVCGALGIPAAIFPVVGTAGGHWPVLSALGVLAGVGFGVGIGVTLVWQRWATRRWRARLVSLLTPIVAHASSLPAQNRAES